MGRKQINILCESCESTLRADSSFCPSCGRPTRWATHDERVDWEVRQWRASRAREGGSTTTMMLVRTEAGYVPSPMHPDDQYVWARPLHPDREEKPVAHRPTPRSAPGGNGNGNGHPVEAPEQENVASIAASPEVIEPVAPEPFEDPVAVTVEDVSDESQRAGGLGVSRKAVAVGLLLAVGLPLSGKALSLGHRTSTAPKSTVAAPAAAGSIHPLELKASRSGFSQVTPDAVQYAAVVRNPNRGFTAYGVEVTVTMFGANGRLIGTATERVGSAPAGESIAVAGQTGVSGRVSKITVRTSVSTFEPGRSPYRFVVRGAQMVLRGGGVTVEAHVTGVKLAPNARFVVVYLDRAGNIVGGDFTYVDVPADPRSTTVVVTTSGVSRTVSRIEAYVVTSH